MMRISLKRSTAVFAVLMLSVFLYGCDSSKPIKVAFIGAVSGSNSEIAVSTRNGAQQMVDQLNSLGGVSGRNVQLDVFDNKGDVDTCRDIFKKIREEKYTYVIGPLFSKMADVTLEAVASGEILVVSPTMSTEALSDKDDNFIKTVPAISGQAQILADYILKTGSTSVSIVIDTSNEKLTVGLSDYFQKSIQEHNVSIESIYTINRHNTVDFVDLARKLSNDNSQSILLCMSALDAAYLSQQLKKISFRSDLYGISWTQTNDLLTHGGESVEGMILIAALDLEKKDHAMDEFKSEYQSRYGREASFTSVLGYSAAHILLQGMMDADSLKIPDVKYSIIKKSEGQVLGRIISLNSFGDSQGGYSLVQVKNNKFTPVRNEIP